ncbi:hypothetical protein GQ53DRAFT_647960, partial [Thozetella sp. PMI_491]
MYRKESYKIAADIVADTCRRFLRSKEIRAIVSHRIKDADRLETKLRERVRREGKEYKSKDDIRRDIVDLAGVRIAVYFPSDRDDIDQLVNEYFRVDKHKSFPEPPVQPKKPAEPQQFERRFEGYSADHYRVRLNRKKVHLKYDDSMNDLERMGPTVEIQVASVLMHAWAEVDHDLVYKTLTSGEATEEELRILDAVNGLAHTGEVLLQQLQKAMKRRVDYQNKPFDDEHALRAFLDSQIKLEKGPMLFLEVLLVILQFIKRDSPWKLGRALDGLK